MLGGDATSSGSGGHWLGGGGQVLGGGGALGGGDGAGPVQCEICGKRMGEGALPMHMAKHERDGEVRAWEAARARQAERDAQDAEYEAALRTDQDAEAAAAAAAADEVAAAAAAAAAAAWEAEAAEAAAAAEAAEARAEAARADRKRRRDELEAEPSAGGPPAVTLRVRLPNGVVLTRRFRAAAPMAEVYRWLGTEPALESVRAWTLLPPPRSEIEGDLYRSGESLEELGLAPGATLMLRDDEA